MQSRQLTRNYWLDCAIISVLILVAGFLVFYGLGNLSLHPWDEAWYATISRELLQSKNILDVRYNTHPFWDHPPLGFYLTSISFLLFGVTEFAARAPQAILGIGTVVVTYLTGKRLKNRWVGVVAAFIVISSRWFLFRSRTGNLDILLTFTQLSFFWMAFSTKFHQKLWLPALGLSLALLSKTTIAITMTPLLLLAWYERHQIKKIALKELLIAGAVFLGPLLPWYTYNTVRYGLKFTMRTIFEIGLRNGSAKGVALSSVKQTLLYFHSAVHRWYSFMGLSTVAAGLWWLWHAYTKNLAEVRSFSWLLLYIFLIGFPFLISAQTEIWHLIPLIPPFALLVGLVMAQVASKLPKVGYPLLLAGVSLIALQSIRSFWQEFINLPPAISEAAQISKTIPHKNRQLFLTNDAFYPTVVFYADLEKETRVVKELEFAEVCEMSTEPFYYLTTQSFLDQTPGWKKIGEQGELQLVEFDNTTCGAE